LTQALDYVKILKNAKDYVKIAERIVYGRSCRVNGIASAMRRLARRLNPGES